LVGEVSDRCTVRRPGWRALVDAGSVRQVARVPLRGRYSDDLAAELKHRARAAGRDVPVTNVPRTFPLDESRAPIRKVGGHADSQPLALAGTRIKEVDVTRLFKDEVAAAGVYANDREILEVRELLDRFGHRVIGEQIELAVT